MFLDNKSKIKILSQFLFNQVPKKIPVSKISKWLCCCTLTCIDSDIKRLPKRIKLNY